MAFMEDMMTEKENASRAENFLQLSVEELTELDHRLAEDNAAPGDTVAWEIIKAEAQVRWQSS